MTTTCPSCGMPFDGPISCREFVLSGTAHADRVLIGLWDQDILLTFSDPMKSVLLTAEQALALAERLYRYAEELP